MRKGHRAGVRIQLRKLERRLREVGSFDPLSAFPQYYYGVYRLRPISLRVDLPPYRNPEEFSPQDPRVAFYNKKREQLLYILYWRVVSSSICIIKLRDCWYILKIIKCLEVRLKGWINHIKRKYSSCVFSPYMRNPDQLPSSCRSSSSRSLHVSPINAIKISVIG